MNGKIYVGSSKTLEKRWLKHRSLLRHQKHCNKHLQASWNKYKEYSFEFRILEICQPEDRRIIEQYYLDWLEPWQKEIGYNKSKSAKGLDPTEETRQKMCITAKKRMTLEVRIKISQANSGEKHKDYGKHLSLATREKIAQSNKGLKRSQQTRERIALARAKQTFSLATRAKLSQKATEQWEKWHLQKKLEAIAQQEEIQNESVTR